MYPNSRRVSSTAATNDLILSAAPMDWPERKSGPAEGGGALSFPERRPDLDCRSPE